MFSSPKKNRRSLFQGGFESLMNDVSELLDIKKPLAMLGFDRSLVKMKRQAMNSNFEVIFGAYEKAEFRKVGMEVLDEIDRIELLLNIWKGTCELSEVNRRAAAEPVPVGEEIWRMLQLAKEIHQETEGAYDITSTPLSRCWGFFTREGRLPTPEEINQAQNRVGMDHVILDETNRTVFFDRQGVELSPASLGKGLALDYALRVAQQKKLKDVILNGGFSSVLASGAPAWMDAWQIDVRNPQDHATPIARLRLKNQGFSSSGAELQFFIHEGKRYGHILDPRTGWPVEKMLNVNVVAPTAAQAEALSTAFFVMGVEKTREYCENHPNVSVIILCMPDASGNVEVISSNLSDEQVEVLNGSC